ncbi:hypothetical protein BO221_15480 [Archangium sp. Cb G35]|nr:hypothetical protein BO221_15480 [Archangium sp. Cb G35]
MLPCLVWAASAAQYPIKLAYAPAGNVTVGGRTFVTADVYESAVVAALLTMVFAAVTAAFRSWAVVRPGRAPPR